MSPDGAEPGRPVGPFDVEVFRGTEHRAARWHRPDRRAVVLGSSQADAVVDARRADVATIDVVRRRSGGGAVWISPEDPIWIDLWVPRCDPLWTPDVIEASRWVGERWASVLEAMGVPGVSVHAGPGAPGKPPVACFGGLGAGEVTAGGRKLVGVAQWRCRQGALFQCAAYRRWNPSPLVDVFDMTASERRAILDHLGSFAAGLGDVVDPALHSRLDTEALGRLLLPPSDGWEILIPV
jgi:lipoate---protein ligase